MKQAIGIRAENMLGVGRGNAVLPKFYDFTQIMIFDTLPKWEKFCFKFKVKSKKKVLESVSDFSINSKKVMISK